MNRMLMTLALCAPMAPIAPMSAALANDCTHQLMSGATSCPPALNQMGADVAYESVLNAYPSWGQTAVMSWPDANDVVQERGGWRAYAQEAAEAAKAARSANAQGESK